MLDKKKSKVHEDMIELSKEQEWKYDERFSQKQEQELKANESLKENLE